MFYRINFSCDDKEKLQTKLNQLYNYKNKIKSKVFHRNRINLFYLLLEGLIRKKNIKSFDSAIDIGCSRGVYSKIISDFGFRHVLGIDKSIDAIKNANDFFSFNEKDRTLTFKEMNAEVLDTSNKRDFVLCTEVIEHVDNPAKVIDNIKKILNPGGVAIISLPNRISFPYFATMLLHKIKKKDYSKDIEQHLSYPFFKSRKLFQSKSMKIIKTTGYNLIFFNSILRLCYKTPFFRAMNKVNFSLSRIWPFKFFTQFYFLILKKST